MISVENVLECSFTCTQCSSRAFSPCWYRLSSSCHSLCRNAAFADCAAAGCATTTISTLPNGRGYCLNTSRTCRLTRFLTTAFRDTRRDTAKPRRDPGPRFGNVTIVNIALRLRDPARITRRNSAAVVRRRRLGRLAAVTNEYGDASGAQARTTLRSASIYDGPPTSGAHTGTEPVATLTF